MPVEFDRGSPGKFDSRTLSRKTLNRWTGRSLRSAPPKRLILLHIGARTNTNTHTCTKTNININTTTANRTTTTAPVLLLLLLMPILLLCYTSGRSMSQSGSRQGGASEGSVRALVWYECM